MADLMHLRRKLRRGVHGAFGSAHATDDFMEKVEAKLIELGIDLTTVFSVAKEHGTKVRPKHLRVRARQGESVQEVRLDKQLGILGNPRRREKKSAAKAV